MEIRNLNTFLHAASLQNITRAAAELGYSQSAVSVQIRQLEQELGMPLFDRIGKNVYLTDFGRSLVPYARSAVAAVAAVENFGKSDAVLGGAIRVGITDSLFELLMKPLLPAYHARFPKVRVELLVDTTVNLTQLLQQGSIDAMCVIDDPLPPAQWHIRQQTDTRQTETQESVGRPPADQRALRMSNAPATHLFWLNRRHAVHHTPPARRSFRAHHRQAPFLFRGTPPCT